MIATTISEPTKIAVIAQDGNVFSVQIDVLVVAMHFYQLESQHPVAH